MIAILVSMSDDFLTMKFRDELWPEMQQILWFLSSSTLTSSLPQNYKFTVDHKLKKSTLHLLIFVCESQHSRSFARHATLSLLWFTLPWLSSDPLEDIQSLAREALHAIFQINPSQILTVLKNLLLLAREKNSRDDKRMSWLLNHIHSPSCLREDFITGIVHDESLMKQVADFYSRCSLEVERDGPWITYLIQRSHP